MIRLFVFLSIVVVISIISLWFIENDGQIVVNWLGYRMQTSAAVAIFFVIISAVLFAWVLQIFLSIKNAPKKYMHAYDERKKDLGLSALTKGLAAIEAGDSAKARKFTKKASGYLGNIALTKLLEARTAQIDGNVELAKTHYSAMLEDPETKIIAIKNLLIQARADGNIEKAIYLAEEALGAHPDTRWAVAMLVDLYKIKQDWQKAEYITKRAVRKKVISKDESKHALAIIAFAKGLGHKQLGQLENAEREFKKAYSIEAHFPPIAIEYADIMKNNGSTRKAYKVLENCWKHQPHPDIADKYLNLDESQPLEKQMRRADKLFFLKPNHIESIIAIAKASIATGNLSKARNHLKIALNGFENSTICHLMAELEKQENASADVILQWQQRAKTSPDGSCWGCSKCAHHTKIWDINCKNCNGFDSYIWSENQSASAHDTDNPVLIAS